MRTFFEKEIQWIWVIICTYIAVFFLWVYMFYLYKDLAWLTILIVAVAVGVVCYCFYRKKLVIYEANQFNKKMKKKETREEEIEVATHDKHLKQVRLQTAYLDKEMKEIDSPPEEKSELEQHQEKQELMAAKRLTKQEIRTKSEIEILDQSQKTRKELIEKRDRELIECESEILKEYGVDDKSQLPADGIELLNKSLQRIRDAYLQILGRLP